MRLGESSVTAVWCQQLSYLRYCRVQSALDSHPTRYRLLLGQLATDLRWTGLGIGTGLVKHPVQRCLQAASLIGGRALMVNAVDDDASMISIRTCSDHHARDHATTNAACWAEPGIVWLNTRRHLGRAGLDCNLCSMTCRLLNWSDRGPIANVQERTMVVWSDRRGVVLSYSAGARTSICIIMRRRPPCTVPAKKRSKRLPG